MARILVVDDTDELRTLIAEGLEDEGYEVTTAEDGRSALDLLESGVRPDLVLLDVQMPRMDGISFLRAMRSIQGCREIPVILATGAPDNLRVDKRIVYQDVLSKPFDAPQAAEKIRAHLVSEPSGLSGRTKNGIP